MVINIIVTKEYCGKNCLLNHVSLCLYFLLAVRNDRNKKKKDVKEEVVLPENYELSGELEELVKKVSKAHQETFPSLGQLGKYTTVSFVMLYHLHPLNPPLRH